jgi:hypothetical protein
MTYPYRSRQEPAVRPAPPVSFDGRFAALRDALRSISPENRDEHYAAACRELDDEARREQFKARFANLATDEMERLLALAGGTSGYAGTQFAPELEPDAS